MSDRYSEGIWTTVQRLRALERLTNLAASEQLALAHVSLAARHIWLLVSAELLSMAAIGREPVRHRYAVLERSGLAVAEVQLAIDDLLDRRLFVERGEGRISSAVTDNLLAQWRDEHRPVEHPAKT